MARTANRRGSATRRRRWRWPAGPRAVWRTVVFVCKVYPMLPSRPLNRVTPRPVIERLDYPTTHGPVEGQLYRPATPGPHPGLVVCLGVVPFGVEHPQVPRLGEALARAGFAALLYWSPTMRDYRLAPEDAGDIASAYTALLARPDIDAERSGLIGTCVGGAFALLAAAEPAVGDRIAFVFAYAPYASMWTLARDIASASRRADGGRIPWPVDPLTRKVFVHSLTAGLAPAEGEQLRAASASPVAAALPTTLASGEAREAPHGAQGDPVPGEADAEAASSTADLAHPNGAYSGETAAVRQLLAHPTVAEAEAALCRLPAAMRAQFDAMSPVRALAGIHAPLIVLLHDRDDVVIPVSESRRLRAALRDRPGVRYTEFTVFRHLDPTKGKPAPLPLARELLRLARAIYPLFRCAS